MAAVIRRISCDFFRDNILLIPDPALQGAYFDEVTLIMPDYALRFWCRRSASYIALFARWPCAGFAYGNWNAVFMRQQGSLFCGK